MCGRILLFFLSQLYWNTVNFGNRKWKQLSTLTIFTDNITAFSLWCDSSNQVCKTKSFVQNESNWNFPDRKKNKQTIVQKTEHRNVFQKEKRITMNHCVQTNKRRNDTLNTEHRSDPFQWRSQTKVRNKLEWAWYSESSESKWKKTRNKTEKYHAHTHTHTATHYIDWYTASTRA